MQFDPCTYRYPSRRNVMYARRGMACSSAPLAAQIGRDAMAAGGSAIDAALAMSAALPVLEPTGNAVGSDCFALIWTKGKLYAINGTGRAPRALSAQAVRDAGFSAVPTEGWLPVTVPGLMGAWAAVHRRFGSQSAESLFAPAIRYAKEGYALPVTIAAQLAQEAVRLGKAYAKDPVLYGPARELFTKNGAPYAAGELFCNPQLAQTLEKLSATGCESLYRGELAEQIVAFSKATGGFMELQDLAEYQPDWVEPITVNYKGYDVFELPPNGHGITALMALKLAEKLPLSADRQAEENYHYLIESMKLAYSDTRTYVADPRFMKQRVEDLLSDRYADARRALIGDRALEPVAGDPACGGTVYFCTADDQGNMVSWIQSNYTRLGSLVAVPGTGIALQNRGANFSLEETSDNYLEGGKRSYHTIIPGFLAKDGQPVGPFGVMGGFMQPQGHLQVVVNTVDYHMNPQEALDAPRFQWVGGKKVQLERQVPAQVGAALAERGHQVEIVNTEIGMGRGQIIWRMADGTLCGGTEPRADGTVAVL